MVKLRTRQRAEPLTGLLGAQAGPQGAVEVGPDGCGLAFQPSLEQPAPQLRCEGVAVGRTPDDRVDRAGPGEHLAAVADPRAQPLVRIGMLLHLVPEALLAHGRRVVETGD